MSHGGMESTTNDKQSSEQIVVRNVCGWHMHLGLWILDDRASAVRQLGRVAVVDCRFHAQR